MDIYSLMEDEIMCQAGNLTDNRAKQTQNAISLPKL